MKNNLSCRLHDLLLKYTKHVLYVGSSQLDDFDELPQDVGTDPKSISSRRPGEKGRSIETISNVKDRAIDINPRREATPIKYFLDGCRRTYYLCDLISSTGSVVPILAAQISSAVISRNRTTGKMSLYRHAHENRLILPTGGRDISTNDANEIKAVVDNSFQKYRIITKCIKPKKQLKARENALAHINMDMQSLEVDFLESMTSEKRIRENEMIVVDGSLQFQRSDDPNFSFLQYAIGISKRFDTGLPNVVHKGQEIAIHLLKLKDVGDRTTVFWNTNSKNPKIKFAFWYMRIHPMRFSRVPFSGIIKIEKAVIDPAEKEDGIETDHVDYLSNYILLERNVSPFGLDFRWASHLYPIYITEQIQKKKFISDHFFATLLKQKVSA